ncbi:hypothetical protein REJ26_004304 [Providencia stuartii]|uniref:Uncharacterized protein n=5 Tax=Gammaproteobacteria TaxID=1236 RepID=A0A8I2ISK0_9GAMM|nr:MULTISPECIES: hypothetical protein [Morganellaceae]HEI9770044.1 hypothetical protein [Morganella morganii]APC11345.1 hypothetical protein RB151_016650 [Providencia rettgeri]ARV76014.1 hypothetical protein PRE36_0000004698 [Providencia rettgeri]EHZ8013999.1 hypothetical protein [Proteus mirabilis]EKV2709136.1 hypothetical protein [Proteus mirabilis]
MSRQRVSKGSVIPKKEFKIATVLSLLAVDCDFDSFFSEFKRIYPKDWERVNKRYQEHERLTKPGKSHPMAEPLQYMKTAFNSFKRKLLKESITAKDFLLSLEEPKEKYSESEPSEKVWKDIKRNISVVYSFEKRLLAIHLLGKYKCTECIDMLVNTMNNDHIFEVQKLAHDKLVRFGLDVGAQPKRPPHHTDPQITQKIASLGFSSEQVKDKKTCERAISEFRKKYPIDYDLYTHSKRNQFKAWFRKQIS